MNALYLRALIIVFAPVSPLPSAGHDLILEVSRSHSDTPHLVGLLWTSDQPDAETFT